MLISREFYCQFHVFEVYLLQELVLWTTTFQRKIEEFQINSHYKMLKQRLKDFRKVLFPIEFLNNNNKTNND